MPFVRPLVKLAATAQETGEIPALVEEAIDAAITPHSGPAFLDFPLDYVFGEADDPAPAVVPPEPWRGPGADGREIERVAASLRDAERPVIMAGAGLYWGRGEEALRALAEELRIPVFLNGLARGCLPGRPRAGVLARAEHRASGGGRRARDRRAARLQARLRRRVRPGRARSSRSTSPSPTRIRRASSPASCTARCRRRSTRSCRRRRLVESASERAAWIASLRVDRGREPRRRGRRARRRARARFTRCACTAS